MSRSTGKSSIFPLLSVSHVTCILEALLKALSHCEYFELFCSHTKLHLLREKNIKEIITNHKGTRMIKDGEDLHGLQTTNLKNLG